MGLICGGFCRFNACCRASAKRWTRPTPATPWLIGLKSSRPRTRQGGASVSGDQVSVRSSQNALPGSGQEHQPTAGDVCAVELVDGAQANDSRVGGMSAPKMWASALKQALLGQKSGKLAKKWLPVSPYEHSNTNSRFSGGCADLP